MIWRRFQTSEGPSFGIVEGEVVVQVRGTPFADYGRTSTKPPRDSVKLLIPAVPGTFYAGGVDCAHHVIAGGKNYGIEAKLPVSAREARSVTRRQAGGSAEMGSRRNSYG